MPRYRLYPSLNRHYIITITVEEDRRVWSAIATGIAGAVGAQNLDKEKAIARAKVNGLLAFAQNAKHSDARVDFDSIDFSVRGD